MKNINFCIKYLNDNENYDILPNKLKDKNISKCINLF